jgi:hypothetical protein
MIKSVTVTNHLGDSLVLELARPELSGFLVQGIDGLGPVKASINTTKMANADGSSYNSAYLDQRDITFQLLFYTDGSESIEDIRHRSYKYFPLKKQVTIRVETDKRISETTGYVESNEPNIFSKAEGCTIVVACPDPYFYSVKNNETIFSGIEPAFEFPFMNDSPSEALLEMSTVKNKKEANIFNAGDSDVGLTMSIHATGDATNVTIYNLDTREAMSLNTSRLPNSIQLQAVNNGDIEWYENTFMETETSLVHKSDAVESTSDYIEVMPGTNVQYTFRSYITSNALTRRIVIATYDSDKNSLTSLDNRGPSDDRGLNSGTFVIPDNAKYVRFSAELGLGEASFIYTAPFGEKKIISGDTITINTTRGKKSIKLLRKGRTFNILNCVTKNSKWFTLNKGDNLFAFKADTGEEYLQFRTENKVVYTGV